MKSIDLVRNGVMAAVLILAVSPRSVEALGFGEIALSQTTDGWLHLFAVDDDETTTHLWPDAPAGGWFSAETLSGGSSDLAALPRADGRFEVFAVGGGGEIYRNAQPADDWSWPGWEPLGGEAKRIAAAASGERAAVFFIGADDTLWYGVREGADGGWSGWQSTGYAAKQVAAAAADGGGFAVFAILPDDTVSYTTFDPTASSELAWENLGGQAVDIGVVRTAAGPYVVAVNGIDAVVWTNTQNDAGWSGWERRDGAADRVDIAESNGELNLLALFGTSISRLRRTVESGWGEWQAVPEASPQDTTFRGIAYVDIPEQDISEDREITLGIQFSVDRRRVEITDFPPIVTEAFDTPFGSSRSTVTLGGGGAGRFDPSSGTIEVPVTLNFDQSLDVPIVQEDVRADLTLSTSEPGAPFNRDDASVSLAGSGTFEGIGGGVNPLSGFDVRVVIAGTLDPGP